MAQVTASTEKPRYGFVAIRVFAGIGIVGLIGLVLVIVSLLIGVQQSLWLFIPGVAIAFIGIYTALAYIPLYYFMLRPRQISSFWSDLLAEEQFDGSLDILDVGCGTGSVSIRVAKALPQAKVTGIDIFKGMSGTSPEQPTFNANAEGVRDRVEFRPGNLLEMPFADGSFDIVTAGSVLHEIDGEENKLKALGEIARVLKPGGMFIMIEILQNRRMALSLLLFSLVWKKEAYWHALIQKSSLKLVRVKNSRRFLDLGAFLLQK